jgi:hypothetical protein
MPRSINLRLTEAARAAIDAFMAGLDYDEGVPVLLRDRASTEDGRCEEKWTVRAYHPDRIRFFEQLCRATGLEFFFECDGLVFLLWQPQLAATLQGKTLDYSFRRYHVI